MNTMKTWPYQLSNGDIFLLYKNLPKPYFTAIDYLQVVFYALELQIAEPD